MSTRSQSFVLEWSIILDGRLTGSLRQALDAKDYTEAYTCYEARPPPRPLIEAYRRA